MDVDPFSIFFAIVRIASAFVLIVFFFILWGIFSTQVKTNDLERFNVELYENIASSQLAASKYIFDPNKLDAFANKELDFVRDCQYTYTFAVEDLVDNKKWELGKGPSGNLNPISHDSKSKEYYAAIFKDTGKRADFYSTSNPAKILLTVYDTHVGRMSCAIEKAFKLKEVQELTVNRCIFVTPLQNKPIALMPCLSFGREGGDDTSNRVCFFYESTNDEHVDVECKSLPSNINFEEFYKTSGTLRANNIESTQAMKLIFYPLKSIPTGDNVERCQTVKENTNDYVATAYESTLGVLICAEQAGKD